MKGSSRSSSIRRTPLQEPSSAFPHKGPPSLTSAFLQGPLHQGPLQGPHQGPHKGPHEGPYHGPHQGPPSLSSAFLQGPSLNEIENCLAGLSAEEMEQVCDVFYVDYDFDPQNMVMKIKNDRRNSGGTL